MLEVRSLRHLVALSRRLNYARAAEDLGISQSALSRSIQHLENDFDIRLFDRSRSGVTLTTAGNQLIEHAIALLASTDDIERHIRETAAGACGSLHFGMAPVPARALLAKSLSERLAAAPGTSNNAIVRGMDALWPMLIVGDIEFLVASTAQMPSAPPVRCESLGRFPVSLMVRPGHPLLGTEHAGTDFPFLMSSQGGMPVSAPADLLAGAGGVIHVVEDFDTIIHLTRHSNAVWMTSSYAVAGELVRGDLYELPPPARVYEGYFDVAIFSLERRAPSPAAKLMKQSIRRQLNALVQSRRAVPLP
jgi:DNA-binding transcriptional LysR family regulator